MVWLYVVVLGAVLKDACVWMAPYLLSIILTVLLYRLSIPYCRIVYPRLNRFLAPVVSGILATGAFIALVLAKTAILAALGIPEDAFQCSPKGLCTRRSDVVIVFAIGYLAHLEAKKQRALAVDRALRSHLNAELT